MGKELSDPRLIQQKVAERIVDSIKDRIIPGASLSEGTHAELVDRVIRVMNPRFDNPQSSFESSQLREVAYDDKAKVLQVDFKPSGRYWYYGVEKDLYEKLLSSTSKGAFFAQQVKPHHAYEKVHELG